MALSSPTVSVVMAVYNAVAYLRPAVESILRQEVEDFEFLIIDDGSTDDSARSLDEYARRDSRIRLIHQENQGLTRSLVRACQEAKGKFIARQDADDCSTPGRLRKQANALRNDPSLAFVSSWTTTIGPADEVLFESRRSNDSNEATRLLRNGREGPYHGSVMFRADAYAKAGGYRPAFRYAQDWDLWLRLAEIGNLAYVQDFLYRFRVSGASISSRRRGQQARLAELAKQCQAARMEGRPERPLLAEAERVSLEPPAPLAATGSTNSYFIGKCLMSRRDSRSLGYLAQSFRETPWRPRAWMALAQAWMMFSLGMTKTPPS